MQTKQDILTLLCGNKKEIVRIIEQCNANEYFTELVENAKKYKILPNIMQVFINNECTYIKEDVEKYNSTYRDANNVKANNQIKTMEQIKEICCQNSIIWIKGIPLSSIIYNDPYFRSIGDIDILVEPHVQKDIVEILESNGYQKLGIINDEIGLRYSVNYHEVQLVSPFSSYVEVKTISGEMNTVKSEKMLLDFFENTMKIEIGNCMFETLDLSYTLLHLFLSAFSNSTTWYFMEDNGLRDIYEIVLFIARYNIDYDKFNKVADNYGVCAIIYWTMCRINTIFGKIFTDDVLELFKNQVNAPNIMSQLYDKFMRNYEIYYLDELFQEEKKAKAYYKAVYAAYSSYEICFKENCLSADILKYNISYPNKLLRVDFLINSDYYYSGTEYTIEMKFLCSNEEIHAIYGYIFTLVLKIQNGNVKAFLCNGINNLYKQVYRIDLQVHTIKKHSSEVKATVEFEPIFLDLNAKRVCHNIQLKMQNDNDSTDFSITELCPGKNTLPIFYTEFIEKID